jgi:N-acetylglucosaminyldiphosphoundecaprenol N-acetyl-beta-D-mannosaminyltransferase
MNRNIANILGVPIDSTRESILLSKILGFIEEKPQPEAKKSLIIFTPNPEFLVASQKDKRFLNTLKQADINIPDGAGLVIVSRLFSEPIKERISGADLVSDLLKIANEKGWGVGIAGARRGDREEAALLCKRLEEKYPGVEFINLDEQLKIVNRELKIVLACHGMVKQENWILDNKDKIKAKVFIGAGGSLDFLTGFRKRAPLLMQKAGLEWFWRGLTKPGHWKRVWTAAVVFPWLVAREQLMGSKN